MIFSKYTITFDRDLDINETVKVRTGDDTPFGALTETWVNLRQQKFQVTKGLPTNIPGERSAINYALAFNLDYNLTSLYEVSRNQNVVVVKSKLIGFNFFNQDDQPIGTNLEIDNYTGVIFNIDEISFSQADIPESHIKINIITNQTATGLISPILIENNTDNPISFDYLRGGSVEIKCIRQDQQSIRTIALPDELDIGRIEIITKVTPIESGISVSTDLFGLLLEYSLDNIVWQNSGDFTGLAANSYDLHIRDQFGSKVTKPFVLDEFGIDKPHFYISKSNPIRYAEVVDWGNCSDYKNDENSLSFQADVPLAYTEIQQFQGCDIVPTHFQSNYSDISAVVILGTEQEIPIVVNKKTNNTRLKDMRQARQYSLGNGKTGIYFTSGNLYNYDTGIATGENYSLNGSLPEWAIMGNYIKISENWYEIIDIVFDDSKKAEVIVVNNNYTGIEEIVIVASLYNRFNFEVYEFDVNMNLYLNKEINIRIKNNDSTFGNREFISEIIEIKKYHPGTVEIKYKNSTNTDIFYSTGIQNIIRLPIEKISGKPLEESETYKTDTNAILLRSEIFELDEFDFAPVTKEMMRKVIQVISHDTITINGVSYVKNDSMEVEGPLEDSNLYKIKATMIKSGNIFNGNSNVGNIVTDTLTEIPGLVEVSGDGYVRY